MRTKTRTPKYIIKRMMKRRRRGRPKGTDNVKRTYNINFRLDMIIDYLALMLWKSKNEIATDAMRRGILEIADQEGIDIEKYFDLERPKNLQ